jgi:hypothetical protein
MDLGWIRIAVVVGIVGLASPALPHEGTHKGSSVQGEVLSLQENALTLKNERGEIPITLTAKTQVVAGGKPVGREALQPGIHVDVHGSKLPGGGLAAREIVIEAPRDGASPAPGAH